MHISPRGISHSPLTCYTSCFSLILIHFIPSATKRANALAAAGANFAPSQHLIPERIQGRAYKGIRNRNVISSQDLLQIIRTDDLHHGRGARIQNCTGIFSRCFTSQFRQQSSLKDTLSNSKPDARTEKLEEYDDGCTCHDLCQRQRSLHGDETLSRVRPLEHS
jgi:hypothetical protein